MQHISEEIKTIEDYKGFQNTFQAMKKAGFVKKIRIVIYDDETEKCQLLPEKYYFNNSKNVNYKEFKKLIKMAGVIRL